MQHSLNQTPSKQDDLSNYIKKELSTLLKQVQLTPPKKSSSLKKIHHIVSKSSLPPSEKLSIERKIKKVQSVIQRSQSLQKIKQIIKNQPKTNNKYEKKLFFENLILQQKQLNLKNKLQTQRDQAKSMKKVESRQFLNLVQIFQHLRTQRLKYQNQIQSLSLKAQKLERLIQLKQQNQEKYLQSVKISQKYQQKKQMLQQIRNQVKIAAKQNRRKMVSELMKKYSETQKT